MFGPTLRKQRSRLVVSNRRWDDDLLALLPVGGRGDPLRVAQLERVDHPQDLVEIAPDAHRVGHHQPDLFRRVDDEVRGDNYGGRLSDNYDGR